MAIKEQDRINNNKVYLEERIRLLQDQMEYLECVERASTNSDMVKILKRLKEDNENKKKELTDYAESLFSSDDVEEKEKGKIKLAKRTYAECAAFSNFLMSFENVGQNIAKTKEMLDKAIGEMGG